jgi:hypothetical protein
MVDMSGLVENGPDGRGRVGQEAASQGLHDHHRYFFGGRVPETGGPGLEILVHVVVLDLDHLPAVVLVDDPLEHVRIIVEGKTDVPDLALRLLFFQPADDVEFLDAFPAFCEEGMEEIKIEVVGLQFFELVVEEFIEVLALLHEPAGELGGEEHLVPQTARQDVAEGDLAQAVMVGRGRVNVIEPALKAAPDHALGFFFVYRFLRA